MVKTIVGVEGMACEGCEANVNAAIEKAFDVQSVSSSHETGRTIVESENALDEQMLARVVAAAGYKATVLSSE